MRQRRITKSAPMRIDCSERPRCQASPARRLFRPAPLTCSQLKIAGASRHWGRMHRGRQTGLSGNIETLPDAIRGACGPSNDHGASSNGYAHAADSPRPHLRSPQQPLLDDRRSPRRCLTRPPRRVPPSFARVHPSRELSLPAPGKTTTVESDASGTPQNVQFLTVARQIPRRTKKRFDKMRCRRSPLFAKRPTVLFARVLNATTMSLQSTLLSVRWSTMDVSL